MDLGAWLSATGQSTEDLISNFREQAVTSVKADLALRAIAVAEDISVDGEDLELEYTRLAMQFNDSSDNVRRAYEQNGAVGELTASVKKSKAFDWLLHHIEFVDTNGVSLDADTVLGHDHDHDHDGDIEEAEGDDS
jgi:trigger factor